MHRCFGLSVPQFPPSKVQLRWHGSQVRRLLMKRRRNSTSTNLFFLLKCFQSWVRPHEEANVCLLQWPHCVPLHLCMAGCAWLLSPVEGDLQPREKAQPHHQSGNNTPSQVCVGVCRDGTDNPSTQAPAGGVGRGTGAGLTRDPEVATEGCSFLLPPWQRAHPCQGLSAVQGSVAGTQQQM